jgi:hypothetical protein
VELRRLLHASAPRALGAAAEGFPAVDDEEGEADREEQEHDAADAAQKAGPANRTLDLARHRAQV